MGSWLRRKRNPAQVTFDLNSISASLHRKASTSAAELARVSFEPNTNHYVIRACGHVERCETLRQAEQFLARYYARLRESGDDGTRHGSVGNIAVPVCCLRHNQLGYRDDGPCKGQLNQ